MQIDPLRVKGLLNTDGNGGKQTCKQYFLLFPQMFSSQLKGRFIISSRQKLLSTKIFLWTRSSQILVLRFGVKTRAVTKCD